MSNFTGRLSNAYEKLNEAIRYIYENNSNIDADELFKEACRSLNLEINDIYKEDIINIGLYCCQIILSDNLFLQAVSGNSKLQAYENVVRRFINSCFEKSNIEYRYPEYVSGSFYLELQESVQCIDMSTSIRDKLNDIFKNEAKTGRLSGINSINYNNAKPKLIEFQMNLTENYRSITEKTNEVVIICSIFVNDKLLLQQGKGKDNKEAFENTVTDFLKSYGIISQPNLNNEIPNGDTVSVGEMMKKLGQLFRSKKSSATPPVNYWDIIQDCVKTLHYDLKVKSGCVNINDVPIVEIDEVNEYVGNIKAGRKLVELLSSEKSVPVSVFASRPRRPTTTEDNDIQRRPSTTEIEAKTSLVWKSEPNNQQVSLASGVMNFPKTTKIYNQTELEEKMRIIAIGSRREFAKDESRKAWNVVNEQCLIEQCKVDPRYDYQGYKQRCTLVFQMVAICSGCAADKSTAREEAAKEFWRKYLPSDEL